MIIDADSHVCEPPDTWTSRMPSKWGELIPRIRYIEDLEMDVCCIGDEIVNSLAFTVFYQEADSPLPHAWELRSSSTATVSTMSLSNGRNPSSWPTIGAMIIRSATPA
jgi:hypothetical protein